MSSQTLKNLPQESAGEPLEPHSGDRVRLVVIPGGGGSAEPLAAGATAGRPETFRPGRSAAAGIRIDLDFFHGPMDLFLHLVQQQEVDIAHVSMREVAEQYLAVVSGLVEELEANPNAFERYDLEQVSEYLVIAATLIALKSSAVLPNSSAAGLNEELDPPSEQFLEELRERLRVYEHTKRRAQRLMELPQLGVDTFSRTDRKALLPTPEMLAEADDPRSLGEHLSRLLKRIGALGEVIRVRLEPLSIVSSMMRIVDLMGTGVKRFTFGGILRVFIEQANTSGKPLKGADGARTLVIGSFLAVLELMKRGVLLATQQDDDSEISVTLQGAGDHAAALDAGSLESEFDQESGLKEVNSV